MTDSTPDRAPDQIEVEPIARVQGTLAGDFELPKSKPRSSRKMMGTFLGLMLLLLTAGTLFAIWKLESSEDGFLKGSMDGLRKAAESLADESKDSLVQSEDELTTIYSPTGDFVPGVVFVDSLPDGASVRLNGETLGLTPLMIEKDLDDGDVTVEVVKSGHRPWRRTVEVVDGGLRVDAELRKQ